MKLLVLPAYEEGGERLATRKCYPQNNLLINLPSDAD
jgi:hypothetical protein